MEQKLTDLKGEIYILVGNLRTSSSTIDKTTRHKIIMEKEDLNNTTNQIEQTSKEHSTLSKSTFFSTRTFFRTVDILDH